MTGIQLAGSIVSAAWVGTALMGCGQVPGPSPPAYNPTSLQDAWNNHFEAFGAQKSDQIMLDYNAESVLVVWNQACPDAEAEFRYQGDEIKGFFDGLFATLENASAVVVPEFTGAGEANPIVEPASGAIDETANVFLVWRSDANGIFETTDTFLWTADFKVMRQNIVTYEPGNCNAPGLVSQRRRLQTPIEDGWNNHFAAFGSQNTTQILLDYVETSIIRVFDFNGNTYSKVEGLAAIETMFNDLFAAINAKKVGGETGVDAPKVETVVADRSTFLVWRSYSHPRATDTFLYNDAGKIVRQNIVVSTNSTSMIQALV